MTAPSAPHLVDHHRLRALTGADEVLLDPAEPSAATALLRRLLAGDADVDELTIAAHDHLLAAVFEAVYGDRVEARTTCAACDEPLEISLSLGAFRSAVPDVEIRLDGPDQAGVFTLPDRRRIRPPTIGDLHRAIDAGDPAALRRACVVEGDPDTEPDALDAALETASPALTRDVVATCPHCAFTQPVCFDLPAFLIAAVARERPYLMREIHLLASAYGWSQAEILSLSRNDRRALARMCEAERAAARRAE